MPQEKIFADFSGGINASVAPDKLQDNELLQAQNVRLDELGGAAITGASSKQNSSAYSDGTSSSVHSLLTVPSFGAVAGIGVEVSVGPTLGGLSVGALAANTNAEKMSFASAPSRVYFDLGGVGYWTDQSNVLTVDWTPPSVSSGVAIVSSATVGSAAQSGTGTSWSNIGGITGTASFATAPVGTYAFGYPTKALTGTSCGFSVNTSSTVAGVTITVNAKFVKGGGSHDSAALFVSLLIGGVPVGVSAQTPKLTSTLTSYTLGRSDYTWNIAGGITPAQINDSTFGVQIYGGTDAVTFGTYSIDNVVVTVYQSPAGLIASTDGPGGKSGTYTWKVTFQGTNGEESDASQASNALALTNQAGTLTGIPVGDARTASRNIYSKGGSLSSYYLVGSIPDNVTTTYLDSATDIVALTEGVILPGDVAGDSPNTRLGSQNVKYPCYHLDRVFWAIEGTNQIIWSKPLNGFAYPAVNFASVGDGKPITGLVEKFGGLVIIKTDSVWFLSGTDESNFDLQQTPSLVGTDWPFSIAPLPDKILFANSQGVFAFNGYGSPKVTPKLDLFFRGQDRSGLDAIEITNSAVTGNFSGAANATHYYLAYAESGQTSNNRILVIDLNTGQITTRSLAALSLASDPVTGYIYAGLASGFIVRIDDWSADTDAFGTVPFVLQTKFTDCSDRGSNLSFNAIEFYGNTGGNDVTPTVYYDLGKNSEALDPINTTSLQRVVRKLTAANSRLAQTMSIKLESDAETINLNNVPAIQVTHLKAYFDERAGRARTGQG